MLFYGTSWLVMFAAQIVVLFATLCNMEEESLENTNGINCVNEEGKQVDWFVSTKLPRLASSKNTVLSGERYLYIDSLSDPSSGWIISPKNISQKDSLLAQTTLSIFKNDKVSYILYNDQLPDGSSSSSSYGHTKGILAFDETKGFWLIHSIPRFPSGDEEDYLYPESGKEYGQSMLCITLNLSQANAIALQLRFMKPRIYKFYLTASMKRIAPQMQRLVQRKFIRKKPWNNTVAIQSVGGKTFLSFSKHPKARIDLYSQLVAPYLKTDLFTETWQLGSGSVLPPTCKSPYKVQDIEKMNMTFKAPKHAQNTVDNIGVHGWAEYKSTEDHSKVAVADSSNRRRKPWLCIGDINRMASQEKRGGGTVCFDFASNAWKAYRDAVYEVRSCDL